MTPRLLLAALTILCVCATWSPAKTLIVEARRVTIPKHTAEIVAPTAADLSKPGKLAEYIAAELTAGLCVLPAGVIKTDVPITLRKLHGGVIEGAGPPYAASNGKSGWRTEPEITQATTTIVATDPSQPAIVMEAAMNVELRNFGIETTGVGIAYKQVQGWSNQGAHLDRIAFHDCAVAFKAGDEPKDNGAADVVFESCQWYRCGVGLEVMHHQGMNYIFDGLNSFIRTKRAVVFNAGGFSHLDNCFGYGVGTWLTFKSGGSNVMPCRITHLNSDRSKEDAPPIIVDASQAYGTVRVIVDGVKVTAQGQHDADHYPGHVYYRLSPDFKAWRSTIRVRDNDLNTYPWGGVYEPQPINQ